MVAHRDLLSRRKGFGANPAKSSTCCPFGKLERAFLARSIRSFRPYDLSPADELVPNRSANEDVHRVFL